MEQGWDFVKESGVSVIAFVKRFDCLIVENVVQGLGGDDVIVPGDEARNAFAVGFGGMLFAFGCCRTLKVPDNRLHGPVF